MNLRLPLVPQPRPGPTWGTFFGWTVVAFWIGVASAVWWGLIP